METTYSQFLAELIEAARRHKSCYDAREIGLISWHGLCEETWEDFEAALAKVRDANGKADRSEE